MSHSDGRGVFPSQMIAEAIKQGWIASGEGELPAQSIQPASLDLRLGDVAYRLRCSFLPDDEPVESALRRYEMGRIDLAGARAAFSSRTGPTWCP
jgi:dCTP deaminase